MDQEAVGNVVLLAIVTLISVVQNGKGSPSSGRAGSWKSGTHCSVLVHTRIRVYCSVLECAGGGGCPVLCEFGISFSPLKVDVRLCLQRKESSLKGW